MSKNLFITGGTGFWGKNVLNKLLYSNEYKDFFSEIMVLTRNHKMFLEQFPEFNHPKITYIDGDIRTFECGRTDFNYIMHLATDANKDLNDNHPMEMMDVVINGTKHVLEFAAKQSQLKRFLLASSGAVYGEIPNDIDGVKEEQYFALDFNNPINVYAQSKRTAEMIAQIYHQKQNMPLVIARGFAFYGDYLPDSHFAIGNFIKDAKENKKITIKSDGLAKRSYMHSQNLADSLLQLLMIEQSKDYIFNVGSDEGKTLKEWANQISAKYGNVQIEILNEVPKGYSAGKNYVPNMDKLEKKIGLKLKEFEL